MVVIMTTTTFHLALYLAEGAVATFCRRRRRCYSLYPSQSISPEVLFRFLQVSQKSLIEIFRRISASLSADVSALCENLTGEQVSR